MYHYVNGRGRDDPDRYSFRVNLSHADDDSFDGFDEGVITLHYRDGYVADVPVSDIERQINEGKIAHGAL